MSSPITNVQFFVREAERDQKCIKPNCGWSGEGLVLFGFSVFYIDPQTGELMTAIFAFPFCHEHIVEQVAKFPAIGRPFVEQLIEADLVSMPNQGIQKERKPPPIPMSGPTAW